MIAAQTHIIALRAGTRFRQVDQCDIAKEAEAIGVIVMKVAGNGDDRQRRDPGDDAADVMIAGCTTVDQERAALADEEIFVIIGIADRLADRPCVRRNFLDTPIPVDNSARGAARQWPELRRVGRRRHHICLQASSSHGQFGESVWCESKKQPSQTRTRS